jgi:hypothetical protein
MVVCGAVRKKERRWKLREMGCLYRLYSAGLKGLKSLKRCGLDSTDPR